MTTTAKRSGLALLAGLAVFGLGAPAGAQMAPLPTTPLFNRGNPFGAMAGMNQQALNQLAPVPAGFNPGAGLPFPAATLSSMAPGYGSTYAGSGFYNPYGYNPYMYNPYAYNYNTAGDALRGVATVINANGEFQIQVQEARIKFEDWQKARLETRRRVVDEWLYERANLPTWQDEQERLLKANLRQALNNPGLAEILSGDTLKTLYKDIRSRTAQGQQGAPVTINDGVLKQINWSTQTAGDIGLLKTLRDPNASGLRWPTSLVSDTFKDDTQRIDRLAKGAVRLAEQQGRVDAATIKDLRAAVSDLSLKISGPNSDLSASQWIEAKRFLNQMNNAITGLEQPDVADHLNGKVAVQARTVPDLIKALDKSGLTFAPAVNGDEAAYVALYNALASYDQSLQGLPPPAPGPGNP